MHNYITIDGGTTNTRINLVINEKIVDTLKFNIGARNGINGNLEFKATLKNGITDILNKNCVAESDIYRILASGMITSEFGLYEVPHTVAPAGIELLHSNMKEVLINDVSDIPFVFISGIRTEGTLEQTDMMRGEETEIIGLAEKYSTNAVYVLPGSHSKIVEFDSENRISHFTTAMSGEMIAALSGNTILKDAVDLSVDKFDSEYLLLGYEIAEKLGIAQALFKTRILKNLFKKDKCQVYSFFLGVILFSDIQTIKNSQNSTVVIGGKNSLKNSLAYLLEQKTEKEIICAEETDVEECISIGAIKIYEYSN